MTAGPADRPTVRIERLAAGGDGVGRLADGRTLFVPRTAPGDLVEVGELRLHKRFARGQIARLVEAGPGRVAPRCAHYERDRCGGCQWQHLDVAHQREAKRAVIGEALRRLGKLAVDDPDVEPGDLEFGYRTKITLARGKGGELGLHRDGEPQRIFSLERCELIAPALQEAWVRLRPLRAALPKELDRLVLRLDRAGGIHLIVETTGQQVWDASPLAPVGTIWWRPEGGSPRVLAGGERGTAYPATVFEQVNPVMGDRVRHWAVAQAGEVRGKHCWDLYAGIGETTAMLVERGATVESVEGDRRAVEVALKHPGLRTPDFGRALAGKVEEVLGSLRAPDLVVTNPPRVGMDERAVAGIRAARPGRLIYISCDPATLARDVARLGAGWRVAALRGFDLFPQTAHVETVLVLEAA
ncbi:MAG TPA: TRAM domain-containing protein [Gemmatimonadales bacterium]|nr:TRAM domain-containing protein [Gemmatimonadales bacterium]